MRKYFVTADAIQSNKVVDYFNLSNENSRTVLASEEITQIRGLPINTGWLKEASKIYNISDDLKDYVIVCVKIFFSDLPNRNGVAFPKSELVRFNPDLGCCGYETWRRKPTFLEHNNSIKENAKGVIFDATLRPAKGFKGDLVSVDLLAGYDRTKDPNLVKSILDGSRNCYSMGSYAEDFKCSVCGKLLSKGPCEHFSLTNPKFECFDGKVGFANTIGVEGFELSNVETPAFLPATTSGHDFVSVPK